jgi:hypothetical protein
LGLIDIYVAGAPDVSVDCVDVTPPTPVFGSRPAGIFVVIATPEKKLHPILIRNHRVINPNINLSGSISYNTPRMKYAATIRAIKSKLPTMNMTIFNPFAICGLA